MARRADDMIGGHDKSIIAVFTVVLALSTIGLWTATSRLWRAGESELEHLRESSERQSRDMQASIKAAEESANIARQALIATDRAWLSVQCEIADSLNFTSTEVSIMISIDIKNVGRSPATNMMLFQPKMFPDIAAARRALDRTPEVTSAAIFGYGIVPFPEDIDKHKNITVSMPIGTFVDHLRHLSENGTTRPQDRDYIRPAIIVPIDYNLPREGLAQARHSTMLFEIRHIDPMHKVWNGAECTVNFNDLKLVQNIVGGVVT